MFDETPVVIIDVAAERMRALRRIAGAAIAVGLILAIGIGARMWLDNSQRRMAAPDVLAAEFDRMAFGLGPRSGGLQAWPGAVSIGIDGAAPEWVKTELDRAAAVFGAATGHAVTVVPTDGVAGANVQVDFVPREQFGVVATRLGAGADGGRYVAEHAYCYTASPFRGPGLRERKVTVVIPTDLAPEDTATCVWHELMHAFGFRGHPDNQVNSVLGNASRMTLNDVALLKALYDPSLIRLTRAEMLAAVQELFTAYAAKAKAAADPMQALLAP